MKMYPDKTPEEIRGNPLQSILFGHRIQPGQTKYEYLIEFLQVAIADKKWKKSDRTFSPETMFPIEDAPDGKFVYSPHTGIALKRFIFFPKSKLDSKARVDEEAYRALICELEKKINSRTPAEKKNCVEIIQNLLSGFCAVNQNRSWFDQNVLPICPEVILPESLGEKKARQKLTFDTDNPAVDNDFEYHKYTYMCRGGEVYYLHLLNALVEYPDYRKELEERIRKMLDSFPAFSSLCGFIKNTWNSYYTASDSPKAVEKDFGWIPMSFSERNYYTLSELKNFMSSKSHPFEKMETLSSGIILQIMRMMYIAASTDTEKNLWVIDVNCQGHENNEAKKCAISHFRKNEEIISTYLYKGLDEYRRILKETDDRKIIGHAADDSYRLFRKLGKMIGIIIPLTGSGMRFTLSEEIIKFLVLAIIPPKGMITLDKFVEELYEHFGMVIGPEQCKDLPSIGDASFMSENLHAFAQKLKDCGFLRDLSDATSIVENPYDYEEVSVCKN